MYHSIYTIRMYSDLDFAFFIRLRDLILSFFFHICFSWLLYCIAFYFMTFVYVIFVFVHFMGLHTKSDHNLYPIIYLKISI